MRNEKHNNIFLNACVRGVTVAAEVWGEGAPKVTAQELRGCRRHIGRDIVHLILPTSNKNIDDSRSETKSHATASKSSQSGLGVY